MAQLLSMVCRLQRSFQITNMTLELKVNVIYTINLMSHFFD